MSEQGTAERDKLAHYLLKGVNKAVREHQMIAEGDRIAVAVSGGKDSLALLELLRLRQRSSADKYEIVAVHVRMEPAPVPDRHSGTPPCTSLAIHTALEDYFESQGRSYAIETVQSQTQPDCFRCSYLRRKALFLAAQRLDCNKVALGHHADDAAQTTLLNLVFHGRVETLSPSRPFFGGALVLIRPLIYIREKEIARFVRVCAFPPAPISCPSSTASRRALMVTVIRVLEREYPRVKINLLRAGLRNQPRRRSESEYRDGF